MNGKLLKPVCFIFMFLFALSFAGCTAAPLPPSSSAAPSSPAVSQSAQVDANQAVPAVVQKTDIPRWHTWFCIPYETISFDDNSLGYRFHTDKVLVKSIKDAALSQWLNAEISAFQDGIAKSNESMEEFKKTLAYRGMDAPPKSRSLGFSFYSSGYIASGVCLESISDEQSYTNRIYTAAWNLKQKRKIELKDLFLEDADYTTAINSYVRKEIMQSRLSEEFLKKPFAGIPADYGLFAVGQGLGGQNGIPCLNIFFPDGNPYFAYPCIYSIPLSELKNLLSPDVLDESVAQFIDYSAAKKSAINEPVRYMPDTHICETQTAETANKNIVRGELYIARMADKSVIDAVNGELKDFYASCADEYITQNFLAPIIQKREIKIDLSKAKIRIQPEAEEFGGFLQVNFNIYAYLDAEMFNYASYRETLLFDLETGKRLSLKDIVVPGFYDTAFYKKFKNVLSDRNFRLGDNEYLQFFAKPGTGETYLHDESQMANQCFDYEKWKSIRAAPLELNRVKKKQYIF